MMRKSENNEINNNFLKNYSFVRDAFLRVAEERAKNLSSPLFIAAVNEERKREMKRIFAALRPI